MEAPRDRLFDDVLIFNASDSPDSVWKYSESEGSDDTAIGTVLPKGLRDLCCTDKRWALHREHLSSLTV